MNIGDLYDILVKKDWYRAVYVKRDTANKIYIFKTIEKPGRLISINDNNVSYRNATFIRSREYVVKEFPYKESYRFELRYV